MKEADQKRSEMNVRMIRYEMKKGGMNHLINIINIDPEGAEVDHPRINIEGESIAERDVTMTTLIGNIEEMNTHVGRDPGHLINIVKSHDEDTDHQAALKIDIITIGMRDMKDMIDTNTIQNLLKKKSIHISKRKMK